LKGFSNGLSYLTSRIKKADSAHSGIIIIRNAVKVNKEIARGA